MSSRTAFLGGGLFKAALAVAPVTDWRFYDTIYTERYMRTPQENQAGYDESASLTYADSLKSSFLLVHGTGDDNVHFQNSERLVERLVAALAESMKHSELQLSDTQLGSLMTGFIIVYMIAAPLFGSLGDARSRTRLLGLGVAIWSVATALAGLATSYASLFAARAAVGVGEAAYGTISPALLADYFPRERRGRVFAVFFAAIPIGSALGYIVGGLVDHYFGWRQAFFVAGVPGLVLAALAVRAPGRAHRRRRTPGATRS